MGSLSRGYFKQRGGKIGALTSVRTSPAPSAATAYPDAASFVLAGAWSNNWAPQAIVRCLARQRTPNTHPAGDQNAADKD
eukprot:CAMPEP_0195135322 /NCGR_PEP_ID=MMETSP0448-20130528/152230_1 /TAXON_ID=66468 /ORGANISM="Heterocapsa triquestra, Strain CCMP 448" /LENGTH=79 /DNA_ID=CAMNT_0040173453 /DNA_START=29 /DNA_END=265 /DNA_ORIENTATION=-